MQREFSVLAEGRDIFGRRPKSRAAKQSHYKGLTETGNRARKVSGTQGKAETTCILNFSNDISAGPSSLLHRCY